MTLKNPSPAGIVVFLLWKNKFLLILRDDKPDINFPNTWSPVTGGIDKGETILECANRELMEEIGIIPKNLKILGISVKGNGFFFGTLTNEEVSQIVLGEGQKYDFFRFKKLSDIKIGGAFKIYLDRYTNIFRKMSENNYKPKGQDFNLAILKK